jgi:hypothetical protein
MSLKELLALVTTRLIHGRPMHEKDYSWTGLNGGKVTSSHGPWRPKAR